MNQFQSRMKEIGISVKTLSQRLGISKKDMKHYLKYPGEMDRFAYCELCKVLGIDFNDIHNCTAISPKTKAVEFMETKRLEWKRNAFKRSLEPYHRVYEVEDNRMAGLDILEGDIVVCDTRKCPSAPLKDIIIYSNNSSSNNLGVYWGRYVSHWVIDAPAEKRCNHGWIKSITGVVCAVYDAEYKLKWERDVDTLPAEVQDTVNTIQREPSNTGGVCGKNLFEVELC